jgi:hypothetical protein
MIFSPTGGLNLGFIFVYHNRLSVKVFPSLFRQIVWVRPTFLPPCGTVLSIHIVDDQPVAGWWTNGWHLLYDLWSESFWL